ncbi:MAG: CDP-alcohol phosphatidyltransferase family protein [Deltaproteobacteria bacterium]|jgi:CDP-diacylglycerol--serine O-phosphatidyltransferase|nr:CDP-alcohol phosphatidyltransferase family protein [Deltaproteobacteria bacterium]
MQKKYRYFIPTSITLSSLILALLSVMYAMEEELVTAFWLSFLCTLFDRFDGIVARKLNATGNFGMELDSLVDLMAFGATPAILLYKVTSTFSPHFDGKLKFLPMIVASFWVIASSLRLAKFNVVAQAKKFNSIFQGIPMPIAAGFILAPMLVLAKYNTAFNYNVTGFDPRIMGTFSGSHWIYTLLLGWGALIGYGMISHLRVPKLSKPPQDWRKTYMLINALLVYICIVFRVFPEFLLFVAMQFLFISLYFHFFTEARKQEKYIHLLDVLSWKLDEEE